MKTLAVALTMFSLTAIGASHRSLYTSSATPDDDEEDSVTVDSLAEDTLISEADLPWPASVVSRIDKLLDNDMFATSTVGMLVYDLTADSVIYRYNERQTMRPASTLKMIVAVTALDRLGSSYEYRTRLLRSGSVEGNVLEGDLYCKGGFDPMFDNSDLDVFVDSVKALGIDTIRGNIYADVSMKDDDRLGEGWCWDDDNPVLSPLLLSEKDNFTDKFRSRLISEGITVDGTLRTGRAPRSAGEMCVVTRRLTDVMHRMLKKSDNLCSESVFYNLAAATQSSTPVTAKTGRQAVNRLVSKLGLKPSRYYIADGCGLSLYNYVSPELEVKFLQYAYRDSDIYTSLLAALPIAGVDGTLSRRMRSGYAARNVHAKTGTLEGVSSLAGYCTAANGHVLCFSIINMGIRHTSSGRRFQDRVCEALCRP